MGRKALLVVCWLAIGVQGKEHAVNNSIVKDNESAESAPHFHHNTYRIYAAGVPYDSHSVRLSEPVRSGSDFFPIKEKSLVIHKQNGFLKDSYGNEFVESPQRVAYKTTFPQQYVRLQDLPVHLAQPLVGVPGFHFSRNPTQLSFGSPFHVNSHPSHSQVYAANARIQALPQPRYNAPPNHASPQQQPSTTNSFYANKQGRIEPIQPHPFQRYEQKPFHAFAHADSNPKATHDKANLQRTSQSAQQQITVTENGKTTTIFLDTKPVLPLLNLNLLHPLTFDKPVVSQIQHFLPKISYEHPQIESHKHENEVIVQNTKQYDTGVIRGQPKEDEDDSSSEGEEYDEDYDGPPSPPPPAPKQEARAPQHPQSQKDHHDKPTITVNGNRGDPHYSYEINSPTYKETFNQKVVNYGNKGQSKPVHYSYDMKFEKKPISYSYTSSSKDPVINKQVQYEIHGQGPQKIVYTNQQGQNKPPSLPTSHSPRHDPPPPPPPQHQSEESGETESDESDEEGTSYHSGEEAPTDSHQLPPEHRHEQYNDDPQHSNTPYGFTHGPPSSPSSAPHFSQPIRVAPTPTFQPTKSYNVQSVTPQSFEEDITILPLQQNAQLTAGHHQHQPHPTVPVVYHNKNANQVHDSHPQNGYLQNSNHHNIPHNSNHHTGNHHDESHGNQHHHHHNSKQPPGGHHNSNHQNHNGHPHPHVHYHQNDGPLHQPSTTFQPSQQLRQPPNPSPRPPPPQQHPRPDPTPTVIEKSRKIIIQEETPEEMHSLQEHMQAAMVKHENMKEEDFEKSYKDAAFGFPAYDRTDASVEKDIYNSEGYGEPKYPNDGEDFEKTPFAQYQEDGDKFPKAARLTYRDGRDDLKEDYFLDYSVSKPESLTDRFKSKANYYKMFKKQKPKSYYGIEPKKSEKYTSDGPKYEYDYSKEAPPDSFSGVESRRKGKTLFVEPQFQYGFEPSSLPYLLDSELSAMATNQSPKSEKPAMRKKIYKENWYIKTSKAGRDPAS